MALLFEILEEFPHHVRRDVLDRQVGRVDPMAVHHESEEDSDPIPITALGIAAEIPIRHDMLEEKAADIGTQEMMASMFSHE